MRVAVFDVQVEMVKTAELSRSSSSSLIQLLLLLLLLLSSFFVEFGSSNGDLHTAVSGITAFTLTTLLMSDRVASYCVEGIISSLPVVAEVSLMPGHW